MHPPRRWAEPRPPRAPARRLGLAVLIIAGQVYPDAVDAWVPIQRSAEAGVLIGLVFGGPALIALLLNDLTSRWPATVTAGVLWCVHVASDVAGAHLETRARLTRAAGVPEPLRALFRVPG